MQNSPVEKIKERLSIEEVVSSYIKLTRAGANLKAKCPFHNEKTPSFFISADRGTYYCFGCGASGDIFTFTQEFEGVDFKGALKILATRAGVELSTYNKEEESEKEKIYRIMEDALKYFESCLEKEKTAPAYLKQRGLEEKTIKNWRLGYATLAWRELHDHLIKKGWNENLMERAGLVKRAPSQASSTKEVIYDRFRGRIMFPLMDSSGRVVAFSGRILQDDGKSAKYLNSPETPIFQKSAVLYGIDKAKDSIRKNNFSVLVEGQMDLLLSHQAGYRNTVATSGTALSGDTVSRENVVSNLGLVRRISPNIVLAFDGDKAGESATIRAGKIALSLGMDVKVADMPDGVDPADLIHKSGAGAWKEAIKNSKHLIEALIYKALKNTGGDSRKAGREIKEKVLPFINALESSIEKSFFIKKASDISGIPERALEDDLRKVAEEEKGETALIQEAKRELESTNRRDYIIRKLLGIAWWQASKTEKDIDTDQILEKLKDSVVKYESSKEDLIFEAEVFYTNALDLKRSVDEMLLNFEEESINEELAKKMSELGRTKDKTKEGEILKQINDLNKRKEEIKNGRENKK